MKIAKSKVDRWKLLTEHGDILKIARETGLNRNTVTAAIRHGIADEASVKKIEAWFKKKQKQLA